MFSPLLILAQASGAAVEAASAHGETSTISRIVGDFGLNWPSFLAQVLSFSVIALVLWYFAFKPVLATLDERQQKIAAGLKYADEMKTKLAATEQQNQAILRDAQIKSQQIVAETQKSSKEFADKQQKEAIERANALLVKAQEAIELEKKKMLAEARTEIARLVVATTQRVLSKELSESERTHYNEAAARELTNA